MGSLISHDLCYLSQPATRQPLFLRSRSVLSYMRVSRGGTYFKKQSWPHGWLRTVLLQQILLSFSSLGHAAQRHGHAPVLLRRRRGGWREQKKHRTTRLESQMATGISDSTAPGRVETYTLLRSHRDPVLNPSQTERRRKPIPSK